ncbi:MAG: hypothetical protein FWC53_03865 [Firmicutes bacterium]|nr:hypothetical protein [Bacillota bacterium]
MNRQETASYENMSLEEFANQPYVIELYGKYSTNLENAIRNRPYIRMGKITYGGYVILYADTRRFDDLLQLFGTATAEFLPIVLGLLGRASLEASTITQVQEQPFLNLRGRDTLIGIVDTGIDYTKEAFQNEDGTSRIRYIWDQTIDGNPPEGFVSGTEYTNEQINRALKTNTPFDFVPSYDTVRSWYIFSIPCSQ